MTYKFRWFPDKLTTIRDKERKLGVKYTLRVNYKIHPDVLFEYNADDF